MRCILPTTFVFVLLLASRSARADVDSGPAVGSEVPALTVFAVTGEVSGEAIDYVARREAKPTLFVFIPADKWSRPSARLLRQLDKDVTQDVTDAAVVVVWLTADVAQTREYLPRAQMSLKFTNTALCVYEGEPVGPGDWGVNTDADVTVVVAAGGKVRARFGFVSANETLAGDVLDALKQAAAP